MSRTLNPISIAVIPGHRHDPHQFIALTEDGDFYVNNWDCASKFGKWKKLTVPPIVAEDAPAAKTTVPWVGPIQEGPGYSLHRWTWKRGDPIPPVKKYVHNPDNALTPALSDPLWTTPEGLQAQTNEIVASGKPGRLTYVFNRD